MLLPAEHDRALLRRRAKADGMTIDYDLEDLCDLVLKATGCTYCRQTLTAATFAIDHRLSTCRAADYRFENLCVACGSCNLAKGLQSAAEYRELLELINHWHPKARQDLLARLRSGGRRYARSTGRQ